MKTAILKTNRERSAEILNRLFGALDRSLARYLSYARPWTRRRYMLLDAIARRLSDEHERHASSVARLIHARRGVVRSCVFPMSFTSYNDLSLEYLAPRLLEDQRALIAAAEDSANQLAADAEALRVVRNIVASLRRYAALLDELIAPRRVAPPRARERGVELRRNRAASLPRSDRFQQRVGESQAAA